ncbi:hypothetical protein G9A89_017394 [Geosiphon pyriformis]|nr:hypothetical protein G9A89_017394 [Geosiphon pyriformis]
MYTDAKVDSQYIKLILDSRSAGSIITKQLIDQLGYRVDRAASTRIITANEATKTPIDEIDDFFFKINGIIVPIKILVIEATQYQALVGNNWLIKTNAILDWTTQELQLSQNEHRSCQMKTTGREHIITANHAIVNAMDIQSAKASETINYVLLVMNSYSTKGCGTTFLVEKEHTMLHANGYPHDKDEIWQMANTKVQEATPSEILKIKNNLSKQINIILVPNPDAFLDIETNPEDFHKHYQNLASTKEEQEQQLAQLNTQLCDHYIMPEHVHNTDAGFDLRYLEKDAIKLEPHLRTCIDLKIALEIPATTMVQLASKSSLAKREINIRGGIIDIRYMENIITMLQNNSEKTYVIEPNEKIAQTIFLPLVKIVQLVLVGNKKELEITARGI